MSRHRSLRLFLAVLFVLISAAQGSERKVAESKQEIRPVLPGQSFPDVTFLTMEGNPLKLREVVSQRPVVLPEILVAAARVHSEK